MLILDLKDKENKYKVKEVKNYKKTYKGNKYLVK
jgi:hypothetical protein